MYEDFVAQRVSALRTQKNVSAREMSLAIGQNVNYINQVESKKTNPSMQVFFYICEYLGVTPKEFFDEDNTYPATVNSLLEEIQSLDENSLQLLLSTARKFNGKT